MERLKEVFTQVFDKDPFIGPLIFLDTETTGFGKTDRIIEIGAISISYNGIDLTFSKFQSLLKIDIKVPEKITEITGITNEELEKAANELDVYYDFNQWLSKINPSKIVAHNARFDEDKIRSNFNRVNICFSFNDKFLCTRVIAIRNNVPTRDHKLKTLGEYYNFANEQAHRAIADAEVDAYIWAKMYLESGC